MSDSELETPATPAPEEPEDRLDEDDRLRPDFVRRVLDRVDAGDTDGVRELVEPLHPADMADLFEIVDRDERQALAAAVSDLLDAEVFSEMNDWVREELIDALEPHEVADIAGQLETDDDVAIIEDMEADNPRAVLRAPAPDPRARTRGAPPLP